jgi:solute carrier family 25 carnitine/acylcarnitine transporter 20/29
MLSLNKFQFKTKMQIQIIRARTGAEVQYRHVFHAGYVITKQFGFIAAFQGLTATWLRNIPSFGLYFGMNTHTIFS